jgi:hypothetical protein
MADTLMVTNEKQGEYRITWYIEEDQDLGGSLGDGQTYTQRDLEAASPCDWEHIKATMTASSTDGVERDMYGFFWTSRKAANAALRAVKAAINDKTNKPWPDWAIKAKAAGWDPPKGWTP